MELHHFDWKNERIVGDSLSSETLIELLTSDTRVQIVIDRLASVISNLSFGLNYGHDGKKGFTNDNIDYIIDTDTKTITVYPCHESTNLLYDADKRQSFDFYKIQFDSIDEVLSIFCKDGYQIKPISP